MRKASKVATLPAGDYLVGDPCYASAHHGTMDWWMDWLNAADFTKEDLLDAEALGHRVVAVSTAYGDGCYPASMGSHFSYPVDAGLLGVVPVELEHGANYRGGLERVTFSEPFKVYRDDAGTVHIGHIVIPTAH